MIPGWMRMRPKYPPCPAGLNSTVTIRLPGVKSLMSPPTAEIPGQRPSGTQRDRGTVLGPSMAASHTCRKLTCRLSKDHVYPRPNKPMSTIMLILTARSRSRLRMIFAGWRLLRTPFSLPWVSVNRTCLSPHPPGTGTTNRQTPRTPNQTCRTGPGTDHSNCATSMMPCR